MRAFGILFGIAVHALFALTVWRLFLFLQSGAGQFGLVPAGFGGPYGWLWVNALLSLQYAVLHSWLLLPGTRKKLEETIPSAWYGCFFCMATCLSLLLTIEVWQSNPFVIWQFPGVLAQAVRTGFILGWVGLFYSISLTGLGYQTGFTPWWAWVRHRPAPRRNFDPRGAYHLLRHPIYLSFLSLVWFTDTMTPDRAVLTAIWTAYIFVGSALKDRRLVFFLGDTYRQYQARVAGYPLLFGPLGKIPMPAREAEEFPTQTEPRRIGPRRAA